MTKKILLNIIIIEGNLLNDPYRTKSLVRSIDHQGARVNLWRFFCPNFVTNYELPVDNL